MQPLTAVTLCEGRKFTLENDSPSHPRSDMLIFLREINTLAAPSHSHTAKLAVTEDIKLSSSEVPLKRVSSIHGCSASVAAQDAILEMDVTV